jgi:hypothetical protein
LGRLLVRALWHISLVDTSNKWCNLNWFLGLY